MLNTTEFIDKLVENDYTHLCVVPCSFSKNVINEAINNDNIEYIPGASEAIACSIAAGLKMSGKKPIVIVQSSGVTNMGSCITSFLKPYGVTFPILSSWRTYKEGDSEIQHMHLSTELPKLIEAYGYKHFALDNQVLDNAISQINDCNDSHAICILKKDSFTKVELKSEHQLNLSNYPPRSEFLITLNKIFKQQNILFIGTTGNTSREMYKFMQDTNNLYMAGNMGGALSVGLGAAKAGKKVIVCGGDAEFVMHMGALTNLGREINNIDLTYIIFDNESNKSTGGQNTYQRHVDYIGIAKCSNINSGFIAKDIKSFIDAITNVISGVKVIHVKCNYDIDFPRPPMGVVARKLL